MWRQQDLKKFFRQKNNRLRILIQRITSWWWLIETILVNGSFAEKVVHVGCLFQWHFHSHAPTVQLMIDYGKHGRYDNDMMTTTMMMMMTTTTMMIVYCTFKICHITKWKCCIEMFGVWKQWHKTSFNKINVSTLGWHSDSTLGWHWDDTRIRHSDDTRMTLRWHSDDHDSLKFHSNEQPSLLLINVSRIFNRPFSYIIIEISVDH